MEFNSRLNSDNNFSLVSISLKKFNLNFNEKFYVLQKNENHYSITVERIQRNIIDFNIYSLLDGQIFFKQGGYFS